MNILIIGCRRVGSALARELDTAGHAVSVVAQSAEELKSFEAMPGYVFGGTARVGDGTDPDVLRRAGIESCDSVAVVMDNDAANLMTAQLAQKLFLKKDVIVRVSDPALQTIYRDKFGLDTVCPTVLTVQGVLEQIDGLTKTEGSV